MHRLSFKAADAAALTVAIIIVAVFMAIAPGAFLYFDITPKAVALLLGAGLIAALVAAGLLDLAPFRNTGIILLLAYAGAWVIATLFSIDPGVSLGGALWRRFGLIERTAALIVVLAAYAVASRGKPGLRMLLVAWTVASIFEAALGIAQYAGLDPWDLPGTYQETPGAALRPPGTFGHASYFACFLSASVFVGLALMQLESGRVMRILGGFAAVASFVALVLTGTRGGLVAVIAGFCIYLRGNFTRRSLRYLALAVFATVAFVLSPSGELLRFRMQEWSNDPSGGGRLRLWQDAFRMTLDRPLTGFGPETFGGRFPLSQSDVLASFAPDIYYESPHNIFVDTLTETGFPGLIIFVALLGWTVWRGFRKARQRPETLALLAAFVAMLVSLQFAAFTAAIWLAAFLLFVFLNAEQSESPPRTVRIDRMERAALAVVALALFAAGFRYMEWDQGLKEIEVQLDGKRWEAAAANYARLGWSDWMGESADFWLSRRVSTSVSTQADGTERRRGWDCALRYAESALHGSQSKFNVFVHVATLQAQAGNGRETEAALRKGIDAAPNWYRPHWLLGRLLAATLRKSEGDAELRIATNLHGGTLPTLPGDQF